MSTRVTEIVESFPEVSETFVANEADALRKLGLDVRVESFRRAAGPTPTPRRGSRVPTAATTPWPGASARLRGSSPAIRSASRATSPASAAGGGKRGCAACARSRPPRGAPPATGAGTCTRTSPAARRSTRCGSAPPRSAVQRDDPRLRRLRRAGEPRGEARARAFAATACEYSARYLREAFGVEARTLVMGVDPRRSSARRPSGRANVWSRSPAWWRRRGSVTWSTRRRAVRLDRLVIVGDGPLRAELESQARAAGLNGVAEFPGELAPRDVRGCSSRRTCWPLRASSPPTATATRCRSWSRRRWRWRCRSSPPTRSACPRSSGPSGQAGPAARLCGAGDRDRRAAGAPGG